MRVVWSRQALADLREIVAYLRQHSPRAARRIAQQIRDATRRLARFPLSGRVLPEFSAGPYRETIVRGYRVIYRVGQQQVTIIRVLHGSRDLPSLPPFSS